ncbi:hypothetical protein BAUCODRAFT_148224 [Baudoinia panamericana UAMH 10762]|uniref:Glucose-methanol-choline oxidoreductase N-terminal domain-containing protein n=1 Tax=Baudoinia panamericana (strain UAMH 10762) TaxID=717646 RepID=M2MYH9_BAUPA|nr:uncharacterized protein BAUCODRAFT_148224 [Baudoinia panamericana UAMH 10762]EMC96648.1 hypothetical protein BAUCODRAFT_148224 [Baudoinia panamericana UAMH 10762]
MAFLSILASFAFVRVALCAAPFHRPAFPPNWPSHPFGPPAFPAYHHIEPSSTANQSYDYIIIGGGTAGLTVANRLTEDPSVTVLVIEYGYLDNNETVLIPYYANFNNYRDLFNLTSTPLVHLNNETSAVYAAATVGGGSVVNGMYFDRASAADYDAWEAIGNPGWGWDGLLPYFIKSTNFTPPTPAVAAEYNYTWDISVWGTSGPVHASIAPFEWPEEPYFFTAWSELDNGTIPYPIDGANGSGVGVFWVPNSEDPTTETRSDARTAYYDPVVNRTNLHLVTGTQVNRILFEGKTAVGVSMTSRDTNETVSAYASEEVVLAAGAIFSPHILQLSGIGASSMLEAAGIDVINDLPGVGMNFQDHPTAYLVYALLNDTYPNPNLLSTNATYYEEQETLYFANRTGAWVQAHGNSAAFLPLRTITDQADEIVSMAAAQNTSEYLPAMYDATSRAGYAKQHALLTALVNSSEAAMYEFPFAGSGLSPNAMERPFSRGTIILNLTDPFGSQPVIDYNTLANPVDGLMSVAMLNFTRRFYATPTMSRLGPLEIVPGANYTSTEEILAVFEAGVLTPSFAHPSCACPMMPLEYGGVVSPELLVYGVEHLSVVDSSIIPIIPATHLCNTVYAIAEKAADLIKARHSGRGASW